MAFGLRKRLGAFASLRESLRRRTGSSRKGAKAQRHNQEGNAPVRYSFADVYPARVRATSFSSERPSGFATRTSTFRYVPSRF